MSELSAVNLDQSVFRSRAFRRFRFLLLWSDLRHYLIRFESGSHHHF